MDKDFQLNNTNKVKALGILIYSLSGGGAERAVSHLLAYCFDNKIEVHLFLMNPTIKYEIPSEIEIHHIEKSSPNENGIIKTLKIPFLAYKYSKLLKQLKITHSLSFLTRPSFINIISSKLTRYNYKVITNERAFPSLQYSYPSFQSSFNKRMIRLLYKKSDVVISNSHGNANDLIENFSVPTDKIKVVNNPIDLDKIDKIEGLDNFFDNKKFNLVTLGRLDIGKNHSMLLNAMSELNNPILRLYIFGVGNMKKELESQIKELKLEEQVILAGFDPNPYKYLKKADLFIFGSNHEGFPNVLLEAMSCGLPILTTNCQSGPSEIMELETVENDLMKTDYGILVPIKNAKLMAKGINYFLSNKTYLDSCKTSVLKRAEDFRKNKILKEYIDVISLTDYSK
ncbi:N-acetylgalactosamine-N,N'-diacetylbacillosaminyl -diphospho-undecaprenol 4-alpha-N-acetylgalactosaminyltransferase [Algibacter agarivorans]|uniref:N-acetylgalactosamine-N, N'-diacetylbacillosaminyl -diphospho-undecaprenol 4-alpha-N-acetylgalactosaminyltransferase n=1 Tax=Algibacter agarivorans TaxID=1109741 RepID=A0ABP9GD23_9FLAO